MHWSQGSTIWSHLLRGTADRPAAAARLVALAEARAALTRPAGQLRQFLLTESAWDSKLTALLEEEIDGPTLAAHAAALAAELRKFAYAEAAEARAQRRSKFRNWIDESLRTGGGALHKITKAQNVDQPSIVVRSSAMARGEDEDMGFNGA